MSPPLSTTVSVVQRAVNVLLESGETERFALVQAADGAVHWRHDTFAADHAWISHGGRLSVAEVLARVPQCERQVRAWTREEIDLGPRPVGVDAFAAAVRESALERLAAELDDAAAPA
jgi:hypothetical protein